MTVSALHHSTKKKQSVSNMCPGLLLDRSMFKSRIEFKILLITFKAIHGLALKYLCDLLTFKSSSYNLRSSDSILLSMPAVRSKRLGDRAFMAAVPRLWNSLPKDLRAITNVNSFKAHMKTYLFKTL